MIAGLGLSSIISSMDTMDTSSAVNVEQLRLEADKIIKTIVARKNSRAVFWVNGELRSYPACGKWAAKYVQRMPDHFVGVYNHDATFDLIVNDAMEVWRVIGASDMECELDGA